VVSSSRDGLRRVMDGLMANWDAEREVVKQGLLEDSLVGTCPVCGKPMVARTSRFGGRFAGCTGYPECTQTYPLPWTGKIEPGTAACTECGGPTVLVTAPKAKEPSVRCLDPACATNYVPPVPVGTCPKCGDELLLIHSAKTGKRFVRCTNYSRDEDPCKTSYPVPQRGEITPTGGVCEPCGSPKVVVATRRGPWEVCLDPACSTKEARTPARGRRTSGKRGRAASSRGK